MRRAGVLLLVIVLIALAAVHARQAAIDSKPLVLLISFDGWRWDYHTKATVPNLQKLRARGVRAEGLIPSYPSKTVPNHYTIVTGLYPGHHGMVANVIKDPVTGRRFDRANRAEMESPMWWGGDPIWNSAQRAGLVAATMFWPGSEAPVGGMRPRFWRQFDDRVPARDRVNQVLEWLDLPPATRPSLITLYLQDTDTAGHRYGPESVEVRNAIESSDAELGRLLDGIESRGLSMRANIIIVSDHGMAPTNSRRTIFVDDYVSLSDLEIVDINPTLGVIPKEGTLEAVYRKLSTAHPRLTMYRREQTPEHWRFRDQPRVPPVTGVADEGWVVMKRSEFAEYWKASPNGGQHGYDPRLESMRGIFVAAGPAFKTGVSVPAFENVDVYNLLAKALGVPAAHNDGDPALADSLFR